MPPAAQGGLHSDRFGRTLNRRQTRRRCTEVSQASQGAVGSAAERGSAANRRLRVPEASPAIRDSEALALSLSATRWQERANMTDASQNTPHWTAVGLPRPVPSAPKLPKRPCQPPPSPKSAPHPTAPIRIKKSAAGASLAKSGLERTVRRGGLRARGDLRHVTIRRDPLAVSGCRTCQHTRG